VRVISAAERERFTFTHDSHWNPEGHRRIGEALATWLEAEPGLRRGPGRKGKRMSPTGRRARRDRRSETGLNGSHEVPPAVHVVAEAHDRPLA
jgi:hypothetical protein